MPGNPNFHRIKAILDKLVTGEINLKREFFLFKKLFKRYPDWDFWKELVPDKTTNSLAWYLAKCGDFYLKKQWNIHKRTKIDTVSIPKNYQSLDLPSNPKTIAKGGTNKQKSIIDILS